VTKLNPTGSGLVYSTFLGDGEFKDEEGTDIAIDSTGSAYVIGDTGSNDFPVTPGAFSTTNAPGDIDFFVTKLNPTGSALAYSTFLGGTRGEQSHGIDVDTGGNAYVTGTTFANDYPTTPGAFDTNESGGATVTKVNPTGSGLVYSTYLAGAEGWDIDADAGGNAYVTGFAGSNLPTTAGAFDTTAGGIRDAFVTKFNGTGSALLYSSLLGGQKRDSGYGIAVDASGKAYVTGDTYYSDFPTTAGAFRPYQSGNVALYGDAFVTKVDPVPTGYPRPKVATPLDVPLVPAYNPCASPNRQHGPPLAFGSCNPPTRLSDEATLGTPDANGKAAKGEGKVSFAVSNGNPATPADEADVRITFSLADVYDDSTLADYASELRLQLGLRITDKLNNPGDIGTVMNTTLAATVPCAATGDATTGASCNLVTTVDAITPGAVPETKRSVWALGQVEVADGGADGDADTLGDNTLFMVQGLFVP
jgi:hypothetical protein